MGCISTKQMKESMKRMQLSENEKQEASQIVNKLIISIQKLVIKLESMYDDIIASNQQIPEHYKNLEPYQILQKLRENEFLSEVEINKIENNFTIILVQMKKQITQASSILLDFNYNNTISQQKKKILLEIVMLYETTYINFFKYQENLEYKKFIQQIQSEYPSKINEKSFSEQTSENIFKSSFLTQDTLY
ncbi:hypothetical protein ABPG74_017930 [Tetrahymena malaccensis]